MTDKERGSTDSVQQEVGCKGWQAWHPRPWQVVGVDKDHLRIHPAPVEASCVP